jgi:CRP/FNR family transcriptional regulator, cyclic AMP receptor protein
MADITPLFERFGRTFETGTVIFNEGDDAREMFIIQTGNVRILKKVHKSEHILADLGKGDFFGEMAIMTNDRRFGTAIALTKVESLCFSREDLANLISKNTKVAFNIIEKLCRRLQNANLNIKYLLNIGKLGIIALTLLDLSSCEEGNAGIPLAEIKEEISRKLKVTSDTIDYFFEMFSVDHSIEVRDKKIFIENRSKLEKYVESAFAQE